LLHTAVIRKMLVDGSQWASWYGYHLPVSEDFFVIWTPAGSEMRWRPRQWVSEKHQMSYFWRDEWYTIHIGYDTQTGNFLSAYCDVVLPDSNYTNTAEEMIYTDLYIDVVVTADGSVYTKDQEVFDRAARHYPIVEESRQQAFETLDWLEEHAKHWTGPFTVIPHYLPRDDWEKLSPEEIRAAFRLAE